MNKLLKLISILLFPASLMAQHKLVLNSGETMNGEVISYKDGMMAFSFKGNTMNFKAAEISAVIFSDPKPAPVKATTSSSSSTTSGTKGVSYIMNGRKMTKQPVINNLTAEKGIVVVEITINKYGNVIKAEPGAEGTTTTSQYLLTKAKQAAESVLFDTFPIAPLEQKGTITITF